MRSPCSGATAAKSPPRSSAAGPTRANLPSPARAGGGPDAAQLHDQVERLRLSGLIHFRPPMPARAAQTLRRVMVMRSRMESFPYVVLEAAAAGKPLIATRVGGIPEIYGPLADRLVPPDDAPALARAIAAGLD